MRTLIFSGKSKGALIGKIFWSILLHCIHGSFQFKDLADGRDVFNVEPTEIHWKASIISDVCNQYGKNL